MDASRVRFVLRYMAALKHGDKTLIYSTHACEVRDLTKLALSPTGKITGISEMPPKTRSKRRIFYR